jgi:oligoendopeptidase F
MTASKVLERKDVPQESKWNGEVVFASWDEWQAEAEALTADLPQLSAFDGELTQGPTQLAGWLTLLTTLDRRLMRLFVYARMANVVDANDTTAKEHMGQLTGLYAKFKAVTAFAEPALLELGQTLLAWAKEEPRLNLYEHYFDNLLRQKDHHRSAEVEEILGLLVEPFEQTYQTAMELTNLDMTFADALDSQGQNHPVVQATVPPSGIQNRDRELRRTAWENYYDSFLGLKNTLASNYITSVKQNVFLARVRGYNSVLEAQLAPFNMPVEVFHNLIDTFKTNMSTWHRYWEAKRKVLGVDTLYPYDILTTSKKCATLTLLL